MEKHIFYTNYTQIISESLADIEKGHCLAGGINDEGVPLFWNAGLLHYPKGRGALLGEKGIVFKGSFI
jgi:hypothetical protein